MTSDKFDEKLVWTVKDGCFTPDDRWYENIRRICSYCVLLLCMEMCIYNDEVFEFKSVGQGNKLLLFFSILSVSIVVV